MNSRPLRPIAIRGATLSALLAALGLPVHAQTTPPAAAADATTPRAAVGLGLSVRRPAYAESETKTQALPLFFYENRWLRVAGLQADLKAPAHALSAAQSLTGGLRVRYEDEGYEADDSPRLAGMDERKAALWMGLTATWHNPVMDLSVEWLGDASGHSDGQKVRLQLARRFDWGRFGLTPRAQVDWLSSRYVDYYYGVRATEATATRAAFAGEAGTSATMGLRLDMALAPQHQVFLDLSATRWPTQVRDSPLVDRETTSRATVGYLYRF